MTALPDRILRNSGALPLLAAVALYACITAVAVSQVLGTTGEAIYPIDDAYIHMALAKNLAQHGVYGVTPFEAANASSSPLWVLLLAAGFSVAGPWIWLPGLLASAGGLAALFVSNGCLRAQAAGRDSPTDLAGRGLVLCLVVLGASLPSLTLQGMEHALHAALLLLAAWMGARSLAGGEPVRLRDGALVALCFALPILRYESLWLTALLASCLLWRGRLALAAALVGASAAAICLVGFWAMSHGLTFLPAPILTKSIGPLLMTDDGILRIVARLVWHPLWRLSHVPLLMVLFVVGTGYVGVMLWRRRQAALGNVTTVMTALFVGGTWIHATFATFGWGSRYEAYLIVLGITALGAVALSLPQRLQPALKWHRFGGLIAGFAAALTIYSAMGRAIVTYGNAQHAAVEVLNRDMFIARFLAQAYPHESILAMNIGAVTWEGEPHLLDPVALGSPEMLRLFMTGRLSVATVDQAARRQGVRVFVVFDTWFEEWVGGRPPWLRVATIDAGNERRALRLSLYVREEGEGRNLVERLRNFRPSGEFLVRTKFAPAFDGP